MKRARSIKAPHPKAHLKCECGSKDTVVVGGGYQAADASRGLPEIDADQIACNKCGRVWWW